jgi:hypothetical protein
MIFLFLAALSAATAPSDWLDQAFRGRAGSHWSGTVLVDRSGGRGRDTARVCREGTSERLDFRDGSFWMAGDSSVFLRFQDRSAMVHPRRFPPPPPGGHVKVRGAARYLGRQVLILEVSSPFGPARRFWVDTSLPAVLKGEPIGDEGPSPHPRPERQFLSIRAGSGCSPDAFRIPQGWTRRQGRPPFEEGDRHPQGGRRHESSSLQELAKAVGFEPPSPPWLPAGFQLRSLAWVETRDGRAAQLLYSDGRRNVSVFWRSGGDPPPFCPEGGCKDRTGNLVFFGHVGKLSLAVTGDIASADLERVAGLRK